MTILILFSLLSGLVTVLSPCVLPVLPIVLSSSASKGKKRPLGVITGLIISFSIFTLAISQIVKLLGLSASTLRYIAIAVLGLLGLSMIIPKFNQWIEKALSFIPNIAGNNRKEGSGFLPGFITGLSLGLVWAPCAGPILASVTALAATSQVSFAAVIVVISYAIGSGIPLLAIAYGGRSLIQKVPFLSKNLGKVQKVFGVIMILTAVLIALNIDVLVTSWLTQRLPEGWSAVLTSLETGDVISEQLDQVSGYEDGPSYFVTGEINKENLQSGVELPNLGPAPELTGITNWINSDPLTLAELRGKVVIVDFWTYSCINCVRTLPYITDWNTKYADDGLVIIGVHTPEFEFEKDPKNVLDAIDRFGIEYPVAQDNDFSTWRAFKNRYWPAKYFIDAQGNVRYTHFGEGKYEESELVIKQLLSEIGVESGQALTTVEQKNYSSDQTPEIYVGFGRQEAFSSPEEVQRLKTTRYSFPDELPLHQFALAGEWLVEKEYARAQEKGAQLEIHFSAKDVFLVMDNPDPAEVNVKLLNSSLKNMSADLGANGSILVDGARLYHLVSLDQVENTTLVLTFGEPGIQAFAFTFGS
jgi:cytochrome c biogenesis protein CcdA/thiol-disulfide isomerase/thioredoxin